MNKLVILNLLLFGFLIDQSISSVPNLNKVKSCNSIDCLKKSILANSGIKSVDCKTLDGKISSEGYRKDLGEICRLYVARRKASKLKSYPCLNDGSLNPDYNNKLSDESLWIYARKLYESIPNKLRNEEKLKKNIGYNNSTTFGTYVLGFDTTIGEEKKYKFHLYFCQTKGKYGNFYRPYFYASSKKERVPDGKEWELIEKEMKYISVLPFENEFILRQIPAELKDIVEFDLVDFNKDGALDYIFIKKGKKYKSYVPGICFYRKGEECKVVYGDKPVKSDIFLQALSLKSLSTKSLTIKVKEKYKQNGKSEVFLFLYQNNRLVLKK